MGDSKLYKGEGGGAAKQNAATVDGAKSETAKPTDVPKFSRKAIRGFSIYMAFTAGKSVVLLNHSSAPVYSMWTHGPGPAPQLRALCIVWPCTVDGAGLFALAAAALAGRTPSGLDPRIVAGEDAWHPCRGCLLFNWNALLKAGCFR